MTGGIVGDFFIIQGNGANIYLARVRLQKPAGNFWEMTSKRSSIYGLMTIKPSTRRCPTSSSTNSRKASGSEAEEESRKYPCLARFDLSAFDHAGEGIICQVGGNASQGIGSVPAPSNGQWRSGENPMSAIACSTRARVSGRTSSLPLMTRETVW